MEQVAGPAGSTWFVDQIALVREVGEAVREAPSLTPELLRRAKRYGLSDRQVAALRPELAGEDGVRSLRWRAGHPAGLQDGRHLRGRVRRPTPYHYSSYDEETEVPHGRSRPC